MYRTHISFLIRGGQHVFIKGKVEEVAKGLGSSFDSSFNIRLLSPFGPEALPDARDLRTLSTSIELRMIESSSEVPLNGAKFGKFALLSSRCVCWVNKSFNSWAFSNSST